MPPNHRSASDRLRHTVSEQLRRCSSLRPRRLAQGGHSASPCRRRRSWQRCSHRWGSGHCRRAGATATRANSRRICPGSPAPSPIASAVPSRSLRPRRDAVALEAEAYAAGKSLATEMERFKIFRRYIYEAWHRAANFAKSRSRAAAAASIRARAVTVGVCSAASDPAAPGE